MVTQLCFDAVASERRIVSIREDGVALPVVVGLPGVVDRRKLAEISLLTGAGASLRYLGKHGREMATLMRSRRFDPGPLAREVAARLADSDLDIHGVLPFTFNQVEATQAWVRSAATR